MAPQTEQMAQVGNGLWKCHFWKSTMRQGGCGWHGPIPVVFGWVVASADPGGITHAFRRCHSPPKKRFNLSNYLSRWWFQIFFNFHLYLEKIPILTNIFQMGWNRQLFMSLTSCFFTCHLAHISTHRDPMTEPKRLLLRCTRTPGHHILTKWWSMPTKRMSPTKTNSGSHLLRWQIGILGDSLASWEAPNPCRFLHPILGGSSQDGSKWLINMVIVFVP